MFIDEVILSLRAGKGGDGVISWRREKYIPKGGPFGGDGGKGGDIILRATTHENTLIRYRHAKEIKAADGEKGATQEMRGAHAPDTILEVPVGTIVTDSETGEMIVDLMKTGETFLLCEGGRGGFGNAHFSSSTRQAPNFAELGDTGDVRDVRLELRLVADVGIVGLPNAGKSTLIQSITNVRPKIADYAFTTLIPNLGVMEWKDRALVIEDVPGLIKGASDGKGLGFQFLKHIDRCHMIIHLIDATAGEDEMIESYAVIRRELENWSEAMGKKEEVIVFSKAELVDSEHLAEMIEKFEQNTQKKVSLSLSAGAYIRVDDLKDLLITRIPEKSEEVGEISEESTPPKVYDLKRIADPKKVKITKLSPTLFRVEGERIEEIVRMTDTRYVDGINRVYDVMEKLNVIRKIKSMLASDMTENTNQGFFVGEENVESPEVEIAGKRFSLENIVFMKGEK